MTRRAILALILSLALAVTPAALAAQEKDGEAPAPTQIPAPVTDEGDEVLVTAEQLERTEEGNIITGEGAVTVRHRDMRLVADRVVYHGRTKDIVADGNVVFDSGPDRIQGEHLELNLDTRVGFMEHAQGFVQTYYFTGERIEKRGPDRYHLRGGTFTTCEGVLPDWSFHTTSADITIEEYLHAWNPTLRISRVPVLYFPYAVFPVKRERATGLLIPEISVTGSNGFTLSNFFYWAPRDNFDATIGLDYMERTGWGASGEMRYLLAPRTQGVIEATYLRDTSAEKQSWSFSTRNSHELPWGVNAEVDAFIQSDREYISETGDTIEERSSESTRSSFYLNRSWSAWTFSLAGRHEQSLLTDEQTSLTRFPELTIDRTSTRLFGSDLFLKLAASGVRLSEDDGTDVLSTTRLHLAPEMTWPVSIGTVARIIPSARYALTSYSENTEGESETRSIPTFKLGLEGPRPYRVWELPEGGRFEKLKHLIEPKISYVYTPAVDQDTLPQFDSIDTISQANKLEYSITNTLYAKERRAAPAAPSEYVLAAPDGAAALPWSFAVGGDAPAPEISPPEAPPGSEEVGRQEGEGGAQRAKTQELLWVKLSQSYTIDSGTTDDGQPFSDVEWEARARPLTGLDITWRGNVDIYGDGIGYHNLSMTWKASDNASVRADWRATRDSTQDFLDLGGTVSLGRIGLEGRSRYSLAEDAFVENRASVKYTSQCWDVTVEYVRWTDDYEYKLMVSLKGIGTVVKI